MYVIEAANAPRFELPGIEFTGLASPSRGSSEVCTWRLSIAAGLQSDAAHTVDRDEVFMVVAGAVQISPGGQTLRAGDAVVVPAGQPIQIVNPGDERAEVYVAIRAGFTPTMADGTAVATPPWAR